MSKITVQLSENDVLAFLLRNYDESEKQNTKKYYTRFFSSLFLMILAFYFLFTGHRIQAIIFSILAVFWFFIVPYYLRSAVKRVYKNHVKNNMGMILNKPITYELVEKGINAKYDLEEATYFYESIAGVSRAGRNVYIHHTGKVPLIIPYRDNTADRDSFIASLEERLKQLNEKNAGREHSVPADRQNGPAMHD